MDRMEVTEHFAGIALPGHLHTQESLHAAAAFQFRAGDVVVATYPKSGTTWMQEILTLMYSKGDGQLAKTVPNWARAPWLEHIYFKDMMQAGREPRIITTHLPCHVLAPALKKAKAKVIYVARNPKDIVVSFYHFHKMAKFLPEPSSFEDFLMQFLNGTVQYGSWFDHVEGWLSQRSELDLFYITYEDLHRDLGHAIKELAAFLGCALRPEEVSAIQQHSSFSAMQKNAMVNYTLVSCDILDHSKGQFMRKGIVGDWRDHFTPLQNAFFNRAYQEKMRHSSLRLHWPLV
ncbi:PREDICTED: sulfotransferase family cytosolic 2B member 1-like [Crocodylus porosus]|uniref:sulfotransferase family cytosolic 2B member 1-like n=1 Tax=Crocodylus porosus TaxID=8502 RepID=UPI0009388C32|nr:PREDICTED: sulfotransferase family cytosolic 2B member 1-like [Crocodylus porosus]